MKKAKQFIFKILHHPLFYILLISLLFRTFIYSFFINYTTILDSFSYLHYSFNGLDQDRTFVYPLLCRIIKILYHGKDYLNMIVLLQKTLSFLSIAIFYYTLNAIIHNKKIIIIFSLMYGICPFIFLWDTLILTESISIIQMVTLLFLTICYFKKKTFIICISICLHIFIMIMTRPAFIYLAILYFILFLLLIIKNKNNKKDIIGFVCINLVIINLLIYSYGVYKQSGIFSLTKISSLNTTAVIIDNGLYKYGIDDDIIMDIDSFYPLNTEDNVWRSTSYIYAKYNINRVKDFNNYVISHNKIGMIKYTFHKAYNLRYQNIGKYYSTIKLDYNGDVFQIISNILFPIPFLFVYFMLLCSFIYIIYYFIKYKKIKWIMLMCTSIITCTIIVSLTLAPYEMQRLCIATLPVIIVLLAYNLNTLVRGK